MRESGHPQHRLPAPRPIHFTFPYSSPSPLYTENTHVHVSKYKILLWALWHARRKAIYEQEFQSPQNTHSFINENTYLVAKHARALQHSSLILTPNYIAKFLESLTMPDDKQHDKWCYAKRLDVF